MNFDHFFFSKNAHISDSNSSACNDCLTKETVRVNMSIERGMKCGRRKSKRRNTHDKYKGGERACDGILKFDGDEKNSTT
jgi:hypothetical protein